MELELVWSEMWTDIVPIAIYKLWILKHALNKAKIDIALILI